MIPYLVCYEKWTQNKATLRPADENEIPGPEHKPGQSGHLGNLGTWPFSLDNRSSSGWPSHLFPFSWQNGGIFSDQHKNIQPQLHSPRLLSKQEKRHQGLDGKCHLCPKAHLFPWRWYLHSVPLFCLWLPWLNPKTHPFCVASWPVGGGDGDLRAVTNTLRALPTSSIYGYSPSTA